MFYKGDTVRYSRNFLRSFLLYDQGNATRRGRVIGVKDDLVQLQWEDLDEPSRVHPENLVLESKLHLEKV